MCGIIGYVGVEDPKEILLEGLRRLEYRGYDSAGVAILENDKIQIYRAAGRLNNLEKKIESKKFKSTIGIGHTRWATHGAPTENNAHPHKAGSVTLVHNGIIENYLELKEEVIAAGRKLVTETDSEIVAQLIDLELEKTSSLENAFRQVLPRLRGSYALVVLSEKFPDILIGSKNGVPLIVATGERENFLVSDIQAVLHRTNRLVYLQDKEWVVLERNKFTVYSREGKVRAPQIKTIDWTPEQLDRGGYEHYMLKEIFEQPLALAQTIDGNHAADLSHALLKKIERVTIVACGTALHAGLVGKYYIERFAGVPVEVDFGSEFRYRDPVLNDRTLLLLVSQSGETADTLGGMAEGKLRGVPTIAICNVRESTLAREADHVLYTNAGPEIGVASTKAFTTQLAVLYQFAIKLGRAKKVLTSEQASTLTQDLRTVPTLLERTLLLDEKIRVAAKNHLQEASYFYLGRGIQYPVALEGALKLKEISYVHAEGYPAGELKHGPIALIDERVACVALAACDRTSEGSFALYEKLMSNVQEVKARKGKIIGIGTEGDTRLAAQCATYLEVPQSSWGVSPILLSVPIQLFAYYAALFRGTDIDKPRNLAKSVTVE